MNNPVAKNNFNRPATHPDRSKEPQNTVEEGLLDYYAENAENVAQGVYKSGCDTVILGRNSDNHQMTYKPADIQLQVNGKLIDSFGEEVDVSYKKRRKPFPGLSLPRIFSAGIRPISTPEELEHFFNHLEEQVR